MWIVSRQERLIGHFEVGTWAFMVGFHSRIALWDCFEDAIHFYLGVKMWRLLRQRERQNAVGLTTTLQLPTRLQGTLFLWAYLPYVDVYFLEANATGWPVYGRAGPNPLSLALHWKMTSSLQLVLEYGVVDYKLLNFLESCFRLLRPCV